MAPKIEKGFIALLCILGVLCISFGMERRSHPLFIAGLLLVICGYLLLRKRLKRKVNT